MCVCVTFFFFFVCFFAWGELEVSSGGISSGRALMSQGGDGGGALVLAMPCGGDGAGLTSLRTFIYYSEIFHNSSD